MIALISSGLVISAHFRILYPIPDGPGAEEFDVEVRVSRISFSVIGCRVR